MIILLNLDISNGQYIDNYFDLIFLYEKCQQKNKSYPNNDLKVIHFDIFKIFKIAKFGFVFLKRILNVYIDHWAGKYNKKNKS